MLQCKHIFLVVWCLMCLPACIATKKTHITAPVEPSGRETETITVSKKIKKSEKPTRKTISEMNYDELKETKNRHCAAGNKEIALKYMQKMVPLCTDLSERGTLMLEVADTLLETGSPVEAGIMYQEFSIMYPGHDRIEYASFKAIDCSFSTILIPERDQSATVKTIDLAQAFLKRDDVFKQYRNEVIDILITCRQRLFDSELSIINFYLHQNNIGPAERRIARIRETIVPYLPTGEAKVVELECLVAEKTHNSDMLLKKQAELATLAPKHSPHVIATGKPRVDQVSKF